MNVGAVVNLNSFKYNKQWIIIGRDRDGSKDTFDCIPYNALHGICMPVVDKDGMYDYRSSYIRDWLNSGFIKDFLGESFLSGNDADALMTMDVMSNGTILHDRVKLLSYGEISGAMNPTTIYSSGSEPYDYFSEPYRCISQDVNGNFVYHWIRSCNVEGKPMAVNPLGYTIDFGVKSAYIVPCIRIDKDHMLDLNKLPGDESQLVLVDFF